jgi:hypothetical protein
LQEREQDNEGMHAQQNPKPKAVAYFEKANPLMKKLFFQKKIGDRDI